MKAILGGRLIVPGTEGRFCEISGHALLYEKKIARIVPEAELSADERAALETMVDAGGDYVAPGFVNVHIHGAMGYDAMDDDGEAVPVMARHQASAGVTSFLPTTMTCPMQKIHRALSRIRGAMGRNTGGARVLGAHMEGPFVSPSACGAQDAAHIVPADFTLIEPFCDVVKRITDAPEMTPDSDFFIRACRENGVIVSVGHSAADYDTAIRLFAKEGVRHVTHLFNGMPAFHHRTPGVVGAALESGADCELIADNIHSHPMTHRLLWRMKRGKHIVLVTDSIRATGLGDGESELGGQKVFVKGGEARLANGALAGSVLTMDRAVANFARNTACGIPAAVSCATTNAAESIGVSDAVGSLSPGKIADIVIFDDDVRIQTTIVGGETVFDREKP